MKCCWLIPIVFAMAAGCAVAGAPATRPAVRVWVQDSFADFSGGTLGDGGANTYVSAKGNVQLVNRWDLNRDGFLDLVFTNSHRHAEKLDAEVYWGDGHDFDGSRRTPIPNEGAQRTIIADLNGDGRMDAIVPSYTNGTWSKSESCVYYGGDAVARGAAEWKCGPFGSRQTLPTEAAQNAAVADFNRDGHLDIVFALSR